MLSIVFVTLTAVVLIVDLERPERFFYILTRSELAFVDGVGRILPDRARRC